MQLDPSRTSSFSHLIMHGPPTGPVYGSKHRQLWLLAAASDSVLLLGEHAMQDVAPNSVLNLP